MSTPPRKKLIEVALPLEAINVASAREKSIRHGHPSTLHLWWARRPLAAARAVIFAQMVDDPSSYPDLFPTEKAQEKERKRLFKIIEDLVLWENTTNERVLQQAREEIWQSWRRTCADNADHPRAKELFDRYKLPAFHDPFAGGGALPLEAQRLGLEAYASDLNPVAVLINKAMIEIPPKFAGKPSVNPEARAKFGASGAWKGAAGLADDVRHYGKWMRDEAEKRIGHLYPKVKVTAEMAKERPDLKRYVGEELTVIAWLWARTVKSPNPAFANIDVPLASTFMLSTKEGKEAYVEPIIEKGGYRFTVKIGKPKNISKVKAGTGAGKRAGFLCLLSGTPLSYAYVRAEGSDGRMQKRLMAIIAEGAEGRVYLPPVEQHDVAPRNARPEWKPEVRLEGKCRVNVSNYGLDNFGDLFTPRQLVGLTTFSDLVGEAIEQVCHDALDAHLSDDETGLNSGGSGAKAYAEAVGTYLAFAISKVADRGSSLGRWDPTPTQSGIINTFSRQALPMTWDFAESNPLGQASGNYVGAVNLVAKALVAFPSFPSGSASQIDASKQSVTSGKLISTDPPYYDNIAYADLSDFFYVWLRRSIMKTFPDLFATLVVPKAEELIATPHRHGNRDAAEKFFLDGMTQAMHRLSEQAHPSFPVTIYYAFKQSETGTAEGTASTGWETFLEAVISAGFGLSGTWPMRTELSNRMIGSGTNSLASSIVLVCRKRRENSATTTRRDFLNALKAELPAALFHLQRSNIAPVDLAQSAIGPGMAIYTRYSKVLEADASAMSVRTALQLINQTLDEVLAEQEGEFDGDTRWALAWFEQYGVEEGPFGVAETLSKAKNTAVNGLVDAGVILARSGKVRLLKRNELPKNWDPKKDNRLTIWEVVQHLIRTLETHGESGAAELAKKLGGDAERARDLAYRLYTLCERKKWAQEALAYNSLVIAWPEIARLAAGIKAESGGTDDLFG